MRRARRSLEVPHGSGTFRASAALRSVQVPVVVGRPTIERQSVSDIFVNMYLDGSGGFIEVVGVGRLFMRADVNVGRGGPGHQPGQFGGQRYRPPVGVAGAY